MLDLSRVLAGPFCTMVLSDLGAEIVKVESPSGDESRHWGPPFIGGESAYFLAVNRNKQSIIVDLKQPRGREVLLDLAKRCDVLVENFRAGTLDRLGVGYEQLRAVNSRLVYCAITGFGTDGPYRDLPGYDPVIEAMGGLMSITGEPDGEPIKVGVAIIDIVAALFASTAILAALRRRDRYGVGERIDLALFDVQLAALANIAASYLISRQPPQRYGNAHPSIAPFETFRVRGRYLMLGVGNDRQWRRLCMVIGRPDLATDPRFVNNRLRVEHRQELHALLEGVFAERDAEEWARLLMAAGVPAAPVNTLDRVFADPLVTSRGLVRAISHPSAGPVPLVASPIRMAGAEPKIRSHPPRLGEHSVDVLMNLLRYSSETIARLQREGAIGVTLEEANEREEAAAPDR